jgi:hypothetical protein
MDKWLLFGLVDGRNWLFKQELLLPLGITDQHFHFILGFLGILGFYYIFRPVVRWLVLLNWSKLLTYFISGFCILLLLMLYELYQATIHSGDLQLKDISNGALGIILFGGALFIVEVTNSIFDYLKGQKSKVIQR